MLSSIGRIDITFVYANQTEIKIKKLNPNSRRSINIPNGLVGIREISGIVLIANASPKIRSESDSIRGLVRVVTASKMKSQVVNAVT
jgi:hypothetical protein